VAARICGPGGIRAVIAENLLLKQQLIVLRRARRRAPNLTQSDRLLCGFASLFVNPGRIRTLAIAFRLSVLISLLQTLQGFVQATALQLEVLALRPAADDVT
jgi:hypothetical protein